MSENPSYDAVPTENIVKIQAIMAKLQENEFFGSMDERAQVRIATQILNNPEEYIINTLKTAVNGLEQDEPLVEDAKDLIAFVFKVACEFGKNHWMASKISSCYSIICKEKIVDVRKKIKEIIQI